MLWHAQHGAKAERDRKALADRGVQKIPEYLYPPPELPGVGDWLRAFFELSTDRHFIGGPIPRSSIAAFPVSPHEADIFHRCIRDADAAYLGAILSKPEDDPQTLPPMVPGGAFK